MTPYKHVISVCTAGVGARDDSSASDAGSGGLGILRRAPMRRILPLIALVLLSGTGPSQGAPFSADPFVLLEKEALLVPPARLVATGIVEQAKWSPDGRYVLALAQELPHNLRL